MKSEESKKTYYYCDNYGRFGFGADSDPRYLKDGGTVEYNAILYSVHQVHSLNIDGGYNAGTRVRVLFWRVFDNVHAM